MQLHAGPSWIDSTVKIMTASKEIFIQGYYSQGLIVPSISNRKTSFAILSSFLLANEAESTKKVISQHIEPQPPQPQLVLSNSNIVVRILRIGVGDSVNYIHA